MGDILPEIAPLGFSGDASTLLGMSDAVKSINQGFVLSEVQSAEEMAKLADQAFDRGELTLSELKTAYQIAKLRVEIVDAAEFGRRLSMAERQQRATLDALRSVGPARQRVLEVAPKSPVASPVPREGP